MPAIERPFDGSILPPSKLYLDTDAMVAAVVRTHHHHARAASLFGLLVRHGLTTLYLSPVSWMEFVHVFSKEDFRRDLPVELSHLNAVLGWNDPQVRRTYLEFVTATFAVLLSPFDWKQVLLTDSVQVRAVEHMAAYNLRTQDAVHLASADIAEVRDIASFDRRFPRVDGIYLWNDRIYGS